MPGVKAVTEQIYCADCLEVLPTLKEQSVDLICLDPPFFTQKVQQLGKNERWYEFSDIWASRGQYLDYLRGRLELMRPVLKQSGSIFLHCSSSASAHLKLLMDQIFGEENFRSEIIWTYRRWSNAARGLLPAHQTIFFYSKNAADFKFNPIYCAYSPATNLDQIQQQRERVNGRAVYKKDADGQVVQASEKKGVPLSDVWEIPFLNPRAKERTGYPTQKPVELLERIIRLTTDEGDVVLDPFMGSGTTLVGARLLQRSCIGIDKSAAACELARQRLAAPFKSSSALLQKGSGAFCTKSEEVLSLLRGLKCDVVQRNKGIDAFLRQHYQGRPVPVKVQSPEETADEALLLLQQAAAKRACLKAVLIVRELPALPVPDNILLIPSLALQLEQQLGQ